MKMKLMVAVALLFSWNRDWPRVAGRRTGKVYEMRTYTAAEGKFDAVNARFRDHTVKLFEKHGMKNIGYWTPVEGPTGGDDVDLHPRAQEPRRREGELGGVWCRPEWQKARAESEAGGRILAKAPESVFLTATDYSPIK